MLALWTQNVKLPTREEREAEAALTVADKFRATFRAHNKAFKARQAQTRDK